jgi:murein DD-endopeptidase MepM/ murein hydrolase activator NlpD
MKASFCTLLSLSFFCSSAAFAASSSGKYIWTDAQGLQASTSCQISLQTQIPFAVAAHQDLTGSETLKGTQGQSKALVPDRSLIGLLNGTSPASTHTVQVVAISANAKTAGVKNLATRGDQGLLAETALQDSDGYVLEIRDRSEKIKTVAGKEISLNSTFWQVAMDGDKYVTLACGQGAALKNYIAFNVFVKESTDPVAQVGVALSDTQVLKSLRLFTSEEAERILNGEDADDKAADKTAPATSLAPARSVGIGAGSGSASGGTSSGTADKSAVKAGTSAPAVPVPTPRPTFTESKNTAATVTTTTPAQKDLTVTGVPVANGSLDYIVCTQNGPLSVRSENLKQILFSAAQFESVKPVQSWDGQKQKDYVQVQFPQRSNKTGWVASSYIKLKSECSSYKEKSQTKATAPAVKVTGLKDPNCCVFPTTVRPTTSYRSGMRRFRAGRGGGKRLHAACDLYRHNADPAVAVTAGTVIRDRYYFYQGVYAIEVQHSGGFVVRYGEILGKAAPGVAKGKKVNPGQTVGYIGTVNSGCCAPMLHFELYSGSAKGALSQFARRPFQRRSDLMDPTEYLRKWEKARFGKAY